MGDKAALPTRAVSLVKLPLAEFRVFGKIRTKSRRDYPWGKVCVHCCNETNKRDLWTSRVDHHCV